MKKTNTGFYASRLERDQCNPREVAFAKEWDRINNPKDYSVTTARACIIPEITERDMQVAATVIQWLGSNVGMGFIRDVAKKSPEVSQTLGIP